MRPMNYIQAREYLKRNHLWFRNMHYFDGWVVLDTAQKHYDKRKSNEHKGS